MKNTRIGKRVIGEGQPVYIIAEAGVNHNGSLELAKKLINAARAAGADAVKFQNFKAEEVTTARASMAAYQKRNTGKSQPQIAMIKKFELSDADFKKISEHCKRRGITFLCAPHSGFGSVDVLRKLHVSAYKFGSADLNNLPVLQYAAKLKKPMIISTGMADMKDIKEAVECIRKAGNDQIIVFQCTTDYPSKLSDVHMRAMVTIQKKFGVTVGYSDHTIGYEAAIVAVALGASVLEKHLTIDNSMKGPDHRASADPRDFKKYVAAVRGTEIILGSPKKTIIPSARRYMSLVMKSLVTRHTIKKGEKFTEKNVAIKRPGDGLPPKFFFKVIGKKATRTIAPDTFIKKNDWH